MLCPLSRTRRGKLVKGFVDYDVLDAVAVMPQLDQRSGDM